MQWEEYVLCSAYGCTKNTVHAAPTAQLAQTEQGRAGGQLGQFVAARAERQLNKMAAYRP